MMQMTQWIVSSSVLIAVVIALRFLLRGRLSLRTQYALWALVLVRLLVPVSFGTSALSVANAVPERTELVMQETVRPEKTEQGNTFTVPDTTEPSGNTIPETPSVATPGTPSGADTAMPSAPSVSASATAERETDYAAVLKAVWLVGAAAVGLTFLAVNLRFGRKLRRSRTAMPRSDAALAVYVTGATETPCLFGLARPAIYLTPATASDAETMRYALVHEQTHYRHGDHLWSVLRCLCLALHWYNPLVWWAAELSRRDAELACDEATVRTLGESERAAYGRTLIRMTCEKRPALLLTATTMTDNGGGLRERITLLVKKPKTAVYTAVAIVLIALVAVVCTFTGREAAPDEPFGKTYPAVELVYDAPEYSMTYTVDTMPSLRMEREGVKLLHDFTDLVYKYTAPEELTLTAERFDALFRDAADGTSSWVDGVSAAALRGENAHAWSCTSTGNVKTWQVDFLYILQQKDGTLYLALGFESEAEGGAPYFRWLMKLGDAVDDTALETWDSMEAFVLSRINAIKESYTYYILPSEGDTDSKAIEVTEPAEDVRVVELTQSASCEGLSPDGTLELWIFDYEVKPTDAAGVLPERYFRVGGNSISDDGYISDSFYEYLTVLHRTDGSYQILKEQTANDGLWYNGNGYENGSEYLYDFYIEYADLDLPPYYNEDGLRRYDGDGWYLYAPTGAVWNYQKSGTREEWYSAYLTGSTLRVQKSSDSAAVWEQGYLEPSYILEQQTENPALSGAWCRTETDGTEYALYLASAADGGSYLITTFWKPDYQDFSSLWGEEKKREFIETEAKVLRMMAQSFAVGTLPETVGSSQRLQPEDSFFLLADGDAVDTHRYSGDGWSIYAPTDWTYTPQWKQWTAPDGAEAHFSIEKSTASMENVKAYYAELGAWPFETNMPSPLDYYYNVSGGYDAATGYAHEELYFIPVDGSSSYVLHCYSVNGTTSERDKLTLRAMAQSFTVTAESGGEAEEPRAYPSASDAEYSMEYNGYLWYVADNALYRSDANGKIVKLFALPENADGQAFIENFALHGDMLRLTWHTGGAVMGSSTEYLFDTQTGALAYQLSGCAAFAIDGDTVVKTSDSAMATPGNLSVSRDRGETWAKLGDTKYIYNRAVTEDGSGMTYFPSLDSFYLKDGYLYTEGVDSTRSTVELLPLRIDLASGRTVVLEENESRFKRDIENLSTVENFASYLTLSKDGKELGGYSLANTWSAPSLNSYTFVSASAPKTSGKMVLTLYLANNDASYFAFYEGTNTVGYFRAGSAEYYTVSDDFAVGDGVGLYDQVRSWYDEAELATLQNAIGAIPDRGQTWEEAAQEWLDAYEGVHLAVTTGSQYKFTWLKTAVEPAEDYMALRRERGEIDENTYYFYSTTAFVLESERGMSWAMAGNTADCTDPGAPEGAWKYTRCCTIRRTADGWVGAMLGTGW